MFKEKSTKKRILTPQNNKDASTLDARHQQMIQQMAHQQANVNQLLEMQLSLQEKKTHWEERIQKMKEDHLIDTREYDCAWTSNLYLAERIKKLSCEIDNIQKSRAEIDYYENTANILFQYYELLENQTQQPTTTSLTLPQTRVTKTRKKMLPVASRSILEALNIQPATTENSPAKTPNAIANTPVMDKSTLVDEYLAKIDPTHVKWKHASENFGTCEECNTPLICLQQDGIMVCSACGYQELLLVEQNRPILRQATKETSHFSYKRLNHFESLEWNSRHEKCVTC